MDATFTKGTKVMVEFPFRKDNPLNNFYCLCNVLQHSHIYRYKSLWPRISVLSRFCIDINKVHFSFADQIHFMRKFFGKLWMSRITSTTTYIILLWSDIVVFTDNSWNMLRYIGLVQIQKVILKYKILFVQFA